MASSREPCCAQAASASCTTWHSIGWLAGQSRDLQIPQHTAEVLGKDRDRGVRSLPGTLAAMLCMHKTASHADASSRRHRVLQIIQETGVDGDMMSLSGTLEAMHSSHPCKSRVQLAWHSCIVAKQTATHVLQIIQHTQEVLGEVGDAMSLSIALEAMHIVDLDAHKPVHVTPTQFSTLSHLFTCCRLYKTRRRCWARAAT